MQQITDIFKFDKKHAQAYRQNLKSCLWVIIFQNTYDLHTYSSLMFMWYMVTTFKTMKYVQTHFKGHN